MGGGTLHVLTKSVFGTYLGGVSSFIGLSFFTTSGTRIVDSSWIYTYGYVRTRDGVEWRAVYFVQFSVLVGSNYGNEKVFGSVPLIWLGGTWNEFLILGNVPCV